MFVIGLTVGIQGFPRLDLFSDTQQLFKVVESSQKIGQPEAFATKRCCTGKHCAEYGQVSILQYVLQSRSGT